MNKPYLCRIVYLIDWRHKRLKNTIDLLLFYREHFYGFSESDTTKIVASDRDRCNCGRYSFGLTFVVLIPLYDGFAVQYFWTDPVIWRDKILP